MELAFLRDLVLIFGASALSIFLLGRLKVSPIVGFIAAGVVLGPFGLGLVKDVEEIEFFAEMGIVMLLFTVGIEFSMAELRRLKKVVILGGGLQVLLTITVTALLVLPFISEPRVAIFVGFLVALSSTAIVLKTLAERGEADSPQGRAMTGILILQDLCLVPFMLLIPWLAGESSNLGELVWTLAKTVAIITAVLVAARWAVPNALNTLLKTRSSELFTISIILVCLGIALLTSHMGLSLALGAFLAGLVISESEYAYEAIAKILPFKESMLGLFFVSVGMLINPAYMAAFIVDIAAVVFLIIFFKSLITTLVLNFIPLSPRASVHAGMGLAQVGEFSFVLAAAGKAAGLVSDEMYQMFLAASLITMVITPFMLAVAPDVSSRLASAIPLRWLGRATGEREEPVPMSEHVIIIGFGLVGRNLARTLRRTGIPYVVLELNSETVLTEKKAGEPITYGEGTSVEVLKKLGISRARLLVIAISDPAASRKIVSVTKRMNPSLYIIVRTKYLKEVDALASLGAEEVIPEEFETSVEIFARALYLYGTPRNVISDHVNEIRQDGYGMFRALHAPRKQFDEHTPMLSEIETETFLVKKNSPVIGHSAAALRLRSKTGVTVMAIQRGDSINQNPPPDYRFKEGDIILLVGRSGDISYAIKYLESDQPLTSHYDL